MLGFVIHCIKFQKEIVFVLYLYRHHHNHHYSGLILETSRVHVFYIIISGDKRGIIYVLFLLWFVDCKLGYLRIKKGLRWSHKKIYNPSFTKVNKKFKKRKTKRLWDSKTNYFSTPISHDSRLFVFIFVNVELLQTRCSL